MHTKIKKIERVIYDMYLVNIIKIIFKYYYLIENVFLTFYLSKDLDIIKV